MEANLLMMKKILPLVVAITATQVHADNVWSEREICRAATKTYFWLSSLPIDAPDLLSSSCPI
jgi:hypothetical protein